MMFLRREEGVTRLKTVKNGYLSRCLRQEAVMDLVEKR